MWLAAGWLAVASSNAEQAASTGTPAKPTTILFVGNSFLHGRFLPVRRYNHAAVVDENADRPPGDPRAEAAEAGPYGGIPGIFKKFTDEAHLPCEVHIEAVSARTLAFHREHALHVIAQARWDAVVLQDYSTGPLPERRGGNPERFFTSVAQLEQAIHAANPQTRVYLYETWPRADLVYPPGKPYSGETVAAMADELHDAYERAAQQDGHVAGVAPVGDAWLRAIRSGVAQENPNLQREAGRLNLWGEDSYHPSVHGAYLAALVVFQQVMGEDPRRLGQGEQAAADLGIRPSDAGSLQRIAYEQVSGAPLPTPTLLPVSKSDAPVEKGPGGR